MSLTPLFPNTIEKAALLQFRDVTIIEVSADRSRLRGFGVDHVDLDHALYHRLHRTFRHERLAHKSLADVLIALALKIRIGNPKIFADRALGKIFVAHGKFRGLDRRFDYADNDIAMSCAEGLARDDPLSQKTAAQSAEIFGRCQFAKTFFDHAKAVGRR